MANAIKPKRSTVAAKVPTTSDLASGEIGVNMTDRKVYINNGTSVVQVGAGTLAALGDTTITSPSTGQALTFDGTKWVNSAAGGGAVAGGAIYENSQTITANYTLTSGKNGLSAGPITISSGVTVTVPSGSVWAIV